MIILYILGAILAAIIGLLLLYILFLFICWLFIDPKKEYDTHSKFHRFHLNLATAIALKILGIKIYTNNMDKIPTDVKPLFVGNHRSNYDPIIEWLILKDWKPAFISKAANFKVPIFGRFIRKCCFMAINRENPRKAITTIINAAKLLEKQEVSVGVYPEGKRSKSAELLPFHNGVFKVAQKADKPIVVMLIEGTESIYKRAPFRQSKVYFTITDVIPAEEVKAMKTEEISERVRAALDVSVKEVQDEQEVYSV